MLDIYCLNTKTKISVTAGSTLHEIYNIIKPELKSQVIAALVDNELKELAYEVMKPKFLEFIDLSHPDGMRTYIRSLTFLLQVAIKEVLPGHKLSVEHSVSKGIYCEISNGSEHLTIDQISAIEARMRELVKADIPFIKDKKPTSEVIEIFRGEGYNDKALLQETRGKLFTSVYSLDGHPDHFYGPLVFSTGILTTFGLVGYYNGILLMFPKPDEPSVLQPFIIQNKMFQIFQEHKDWNQILGVKSIGSINKAIQNGLANNLIQVNEALHEKKYAYIADRIADKSKKDVKLVLISGPSSSGKTTSAKRLALQLKVEKLNPVIIELDNYFVNREHTPLDEFGHYDFESLHAIDLDFFNQQMRDLFEGKKVRLPKFDFITGKRNFMDHEISLASNDVLVIEGIHGLNPELMQAVNDNHVFRIYASALTSVSIDENNRIPTTDNRLIRRIVRDAATRGYSAKETIFRWQSVRRGEDKNIFPYQENADIMFNSSLLYELCILRKYVEPLLRKVQPCCSEYAEALRLLKFISYFEPIDSKDEANIPPTSVLREFIGGSSFKY